MATSNQNPENITAQQMGVASVMTPTSERGNHKEMEPLQLR